jgi:nucleoside-diphosphate-sugar epimerase
MKEIDKSRPVMITGATGFVAGWIVKQLLDEGITVHAAVRNPNDKNKLKYLDELAAKSKGSIKYFKADLLEKGSYKAAMEGCELVYHTASPFKMVVKNNQTDLVDPALNGTRNVLESVNETPSVKRVVLTSSVASVYGDNKDAESIPGGIFTEEHWNITSTLNHQPYSYSKVVAEKEAWAINKLQNRWDLVTILPSFVLGPGINPRMTSESFQIIRQLGNGLTKFGVPNLHLGEIDIRDLAEAQYRAGFTPTAKGRYIISNEHITLLKIAQILRSKYGNKYPFPKSEFPKILVWLFAPFAGYKRKMISNNIGIPLKLDNSKAIKELGMKYRPANETIIDFFQQMIDNGVFGKKK